MNPNPVDTNVVYPLASNVKSGRYHTVEGSQKTLADFPLSSKRIRPPLKIKSPNASYIRYSVPEPTGVLDQNGWYPGEISVFPRNIYKREPFANKTPSLAPPRDLNLLYTYAPTGEPCRERDNHTVTASRFGYNRFPETYEYGTGTQSRGYVEPYGCHSCANDTPPNVAPKKFYTTYHLKGTPTEFRKMVGQGPFVCDGQYGYVLGKNF